MPNGTSHFEGNTQNFNYRSSALLRSATLRSDSDGG